MLERDLVISNPSGLHARPATVLVQAAQRFQSAIGIRLDGRTANAKSIIEVLTLGAERGAHIRVRVDGSDEKKALGAIVKVVRSGLGESVP